MFTLHFVKRFFFEFFFLKDLKVYKNLLVIKKFNFNTELVYKRAFINFKF